jgi:hypothetical protein
MRTASAFDVETLRSEFPALGSRSTAGRPFSSTVPAVRRCPSG